MAQLLADDGKVTSDEYFHWWAQAFTDPAPSYQEWTPTGSPRFPLLFTLKFLLARAAKGEQVTTYAQIIGAYEKSGFDGEEDQTAFLNIALKPWSKVNASEDRQARESIQVLSQISYLSATQIDVTTSLDTDDALDIFESLAAVRGNQKYDSEEEILRVAADFEGSVAGLELDYSKSVLDQAVESGFLEGTRVEKTHIRLERNANVRKAFFALNPSSSCHLCERDTATEYPWTDRVLDVHHLLPLCSGTRSTTGGTVLTDLVALCPTCHRAVHRFYAKWLKDMGKKDFQDTNEAREAYEAARENRKNS